MSKIEYLRKSFIYRIIEKNVKIKNSLFIRIFLKRNFLIHLIIRKYAKKSNFFFIQIGSNDGMKGDLIYRYVIKYNWRGILVEPIKYIFDKLVKNYENQRSLIFENVAISDKDEFRTFYRLKENNDGLPSWYDEIGSFFSDVVLSHRYGIPNINDYLITEKVKCYSFNTLIKKNMVKKIDLLHIDAEGYDYEIIKMVDFSKIIPRMILYEHTHLNDDDKEKCIDFLKSKKYSLVINKHSNTLAYFKRIKKDI